MDVIGGVVHRAGLPPQASESTYRSARMDDRGNLHVHRRGDIYTPLVEEGSYQFASTGIGTAVAPTSATRTTFLATEALLILFNNNAAGGKKIIPDFIRLVWATAPTGSSNFQVAAVLDTGNRKSAGGTVLTPACPNMGLSPTTGAVLTVGNVTATAASGSVRTIGRGNISTAIPAIAENYNILFSQEAWQHTDKSVFFRPCVIAPQTSLVVYGWSTGMTAAGTVEIEVGYYEL